MASNCASIPAGITAFGGKTKPALYMVPAFSEAVCGSRSFTVVGVATMSVHHHWRLIYRSGSSRGLSRCLVERTSATCSSARCRPLVHVPYDNQQNDCRHGYDYHLGAHVTTPSGDPDGSSVRARALPAEITGAAVVGIHGNISMSPLSRSSA